MARLRSMIVGGAAFLLSHVLMVFSWASFSPGAGYRPWFLNAGRAVLFTAIWLLAAAAVDSALAASTRRDALVRGANVAAGAFLAMVIVIVAAGPGTLFPIALAIGAAIALICAVSGALVGWSVRQTPRAGARK